jgi:6-phosphogluconolactonase
MERMIEFASKNELEFSLSQQIAQDLKAAIEHKGSATLLLSGGSTPSGVYRLLSEENLDWAQVHVGLVDERFVPADSPFSNFKLLQETLGQNAAKNATIHPMVLNSSDYAQNLKEIEVAYRIFTDPDICLLGMGPDGHTASLFPNDSASLKANLDEDTLLSNTNAPAEPNLRITFNGPVLRRVNHLYLMITGAQKKAIFEDSEALQLPIAAFKKALTQTFYTSAS